MLQCSMATSLNCNVEFDNRDFSYKSIIKGGINIFLRFPEVNNGNLHESSDVDQETLGFKDESEIKDKVEDRPLVSVLEQKFDDVIHIYSDFIKKLEPLKIVRKELDPGNHQALENEPSSLCNNLTNLNSNVNNLKGTLQDMKMYNLRREEIYEGYHSHSELLPKLCNFLDNE